MTPLLRGQGFLGPFQSIKMWEVSFIPRLLLIALVTQRLTSHSYGGESGVCGRV